MTAANPAADGGAPVAQKGPVAGHPEINWTMLHYAGNGLFSYEEDIYNPNEFGVMVGAYLKARKAAGIN